MGGVFTQAGPNSDIGSCEIQHAKSLVQPAAGSVSLIAMLVSGLRVLLGTLSMFFALGMIAQKEPWLERSLVCRSGVACYQAFQSVRRGLPRHRPKLRVSDVASSNV